MPIQIDKFTNNRYIENGGLLPIEEPVNCNVQVHRCADSSRGITPIKALEVYRHKLSYYEQHEILKYNKIYYVGQTAEKHSMSRKKVDALSTKNGISIIQNKNENYESKNGQPVFNDSENFYRIIKHDHILYRYEILYLLGKGSFGQVVAVYDHLKQCKVALKIIRTEPRFTKQACEEIRILETLRDLKSSTSSDFPIVHLFDHFNFRNHTCMTFELLQMNLYDLLKQNKFAGLARDRVRRITYQILKALQFIQQAGIIHCDLKPENVLLVCPQDFKHQSTWDSANPKDQIKVIDFGSSCFVKDQPYPYIQSRFYRAPEILFRHHYDYAIDIWSFGCLVGELINGLPLFPGEDEPDQMACIMEVLGLPHPVLLRDSAQFDRYFVELKMDSYSKSASLFLDKKLIKLNDTCYIPRYCIVRQLEADGLPQILPGLSKRGGHVRGLPGSVSLFQAITTSRLKRYRAKESRSVADILSNVTQSNGYLDEHKSYLDNDNELLINLVSSCLKWLPMDRVKPNKALQHSWFAHFNQTMPNHSNLNHGRIKSMEISKFTGIQNGCTNECLTHKHGHSLRPVARPNGLSSSQIFAVNSKKTCPHLLLVDAQNSPIDESTLKLNYRKSLIHVSCSPIAPDPPPRLTSTQSNANILLNRRLTSIYNQYAQENVSARGSNKVLMSSDCLNMSDDSHAANQDSSCPDHHTLTTCSSQLKKLIHSRADQHNHHVNSSVSYQNLTHCNGTESHRPPTTILYRPNSKYESQCSLMSIGETADLKVDQHQHHHHNHNHHNHHHHHHHSDSHMISTNATIMINNPNLNKSIGNLHDNTLRDTTLQTVNKIVTIPNKYNTISHIAEGYSTLPLSVRRAKLVNMSNSIPKTQAMCANALTSKDSTCHYRSHQPHHRQLSNYSTLQLNKSNISQSKLSDGDEANRRPEWPTHRIKLIQTLNSDPPPEIAPKPAKTLYLTAKLLGDHDQQLNQVWGLQPCRQVVDKQNQNNSEGNNNYAVIETNAKINNGLGVQQLLKQSSNSYDHKNNE